MIDVIQKEIEIPTEKFDRTRLMGATELDIMRAGLEEIM